MKRLLLSLCLLLGTTATTGAIAQPAVQIVDDRGATVRLPRVPQRVVTLLPSLTETVCELGACARLVGVDNYSNWPASVRALPHVGGLEDANIEVIVALKPDVVLLSNSSRALARLESLGVPVVGLDLKTLADVRRVLGKVSQLLATGDAEALWQRMNEGLAAAARTVPVAARGTRTYFEVGGGGYAASTASHIGEVLARLGAANVVPGELGTVPKLNPEFIVRADPQLVIVGAGNAAELPLRPGWDRIRAVREGRICAFTPAEGDVIMRPGPRLAEAARVLARCLQPAARGKAG
jgi:iron complex transport system substrate-binding protein